MTARRSVLNTFLFVFINFILVFVLVGILDGSFLDYKMGFYLLSPVILGLTFYLGYYFFLQTKRIVKRKIGWLNYSWTLAFVIPNMVLLFFNYLLWLDLFDGTTDTILP